jgi:hypothetical protein
MSLQGGDFMLIIVEFAADDADRVHYMLKAFSGAADSRPASVNDEFGEVLARAQQKW